MPLPHAPVPPATITSRRHPLVRRVRAAADGHAGEVLLEGPHLVAEALAGACTVRLVVASEEAAQRPEGAGLLARAAAHGVPVQRVTAAVLDAVSPTRTPAGVLALASLALASVDALVGAATPLVTVAVGVQDPGNMGTLMRSSEAAGATGLAALGTTAHPFGWKALRGSMGSALRLPVLRDPDARPTLRALRGRGLCVVALDARGAIPLYEADLAVPVALCAGGEGAGLSAEVLAMADVRVRIPMAAPVESLNVGVAASLVLFEARRQRETRR